MAKLEKGLAEGIQPEAHKETTMEPLEKEIEAFDRMEEDLKRDHFDKWVVFQGGALVGVHESFEAAAADSAHTFEGGTYLIRQVGELPERLPSAAMYGKDYAYG